MPGIAGIVDLDGRFDLEKKIDGMLSVMKHELEYKVERFHQTPLALGKASPGIIDHHPQPIFNLDQSLCLVMYGEIYHYPDDLFECVNEITPSQPGNHALSVLNLIATRGMEIVKKLNGSFVLALWNFRNKTLTIANDRYGLRPLYYFRQDNLFIFSSEMKSILTFSEVAKEVDIEGLVQFFSFGVIMRERTLFKRIKTLSPASMLVFKDRGLGIETYWTLNLEEANEKFNENQALDMAYHLVKQAVKRQTGDDIPKILSLSGGLDSRTLLGAAVQTGNEIPTFTFGTPDCPDMKLAQSIAHSLGVENRFFELSPDYLQKWIKPGVWLTEGMNNCVNFHGIEFIPQIRKQAQVVLNGFLGGELFGFLSLTFARLLFLGKSKDWMGALYRWINHPFTEPELRNLFQTKYHSQIKGISFRSFVKLMRECPSDSLFNQFYHYRFREQAPKSFLYGLLLDNNLVEYRLPFCDYDLVDFVSTIPPRQKALAIFHRRLLTEKFPPLGSIPYQRTGLPVSSSITRILLRKATEKFKESIFRSKIDKRGYSDYDSWMRHELKDFLMSVLLSERSLNRGYFDSDYVKRLVTQHLSGNKNLSSRLGALLTFEIWNRLFIDQEPLITIRIQS